MNLFLLSLLCFLLSYTLYRNTISGRDTIISMFVDKLLKLVRVPKALVSADRCQDYYYVFILLNHLLKVVSQAVWLTFPQILQYLVEECHVHD